jgi:NAD(P)H-dependent flavin oxidoreductase YrpB (nitropropane dioxygenase family)
VDGPEPRLSQDSPPAGLPREQVARLKGVGFKVGSLIGNADRVRSQLDASVELPVAQGTEAGGHTGSITSMVMWPQIVDLAGDNPVLAAGGIGQGMLEEFLDSTERLNRLISQ